MGKNHDFDTERFSKIIKQVHPTTECFQIHQKHLRWVSLCFSGLFGQFGVALKTIYLFGCLRGTLVVTKVLAGFLVSSESVNYPRGHEVALLLLSFIALCRKF